MPHTSNTLSSPSLNVFSDFHGHVLHAIHDLQGEGYLLPDLDISRVTIEIPKDSTHGDMATNAAMVLAKVAGKSPRELATKIIEKLQNNPDIADVQIAGPGFINMTLTPAFWQNQLRAILCAKKSFGSSNLGKGEAINVEFVSVNPTGPMHAGHGRGAVMGDVLSSLLSRIGYNVTREYYVNDAGNQTHVVARSLYLRYLQAHGRIVEETQFQGLYPGDYLVELAEVLKSQVGDKFVDQPESVWLDPLRDFAIPAIMEMIRGDLDALGVHMDVYTSEKELTLKGGVDVALKTLQDKGDVYLGVLEKPKGHDADDWEERPQTLFRATEYGDDVDRPLQKSDGSWTYFAGDIAYHYDKYRRGFKKMIDILGADHVGYVKRIQAATRAITNKEASVEIKTCQLVNIVENGLPVKMSKRAGNYITLRDVIDRVGKDVTRFIMLTRHQDVTFDFDFKKVVEQTKDNPVFYVQYAHARAHSVLRHARQLLGEDILADMGVDFVKADTSLLTDESELEMIKILAQLPRTIELAANLREPHRVSAYVYDVASTFHGLWNKGKDHVELRFIDPNNKELTLARMALLNAVILVIANCFDVFGVTPVEEMRS